MIELRKIIQRQLKGIHPRVYFQMAPETATFPYLVYDIVNINDDGEGHQLVTFDVDGWNDENDTTALENLMESVNAGMNKKVAVEGNTTVVFYLESKIPIFDDETALKRRKYTYQGRLFGRS